MSQDKITVREFCLRHTQVNELCIVRDCGWIIAAVWIDAEDLFSMNPKIAERIVKSNEWGELPVVTKSGDTIHIPCHYIDC